MDAVSVSPYKLLVTVIHARNLPIADLTTSDPYVVISVGGKPLGRTKTIKRNHLNPEWNEGFYGAIFHMEQAVDLLIYDEDLSSDNLLGTVSVNIKDLTVNTMQEYTLDIKNAGRYKAKATLTVALLLGRKDGTIKISSDEQLVAKRKNSVALFSKTIGQEACWIHSHDLIRESLGDFFSSPYCVLRKDRALLRDLLFDATSLSGGDIADNYQITHARTQFRLINSTKLVLADAKFSRFAPLPENTLKINFGEDEQYSLQITLMNRFTLWVWVQWLQIAHRHWTGASPRSELPDWALIEEFTSSANRLIFRAANGKCRELMGAISISINNPFQLRFGGEYIPLSNMASIVLSTDCSIARRFTLEIEVITDRDVHGDDSTAYTQSALDSSASEKEQPLEARRAKRPFRVARAVFSTVSSLASASASTASTVACTATNVATNVVTGVASTAVNAARTIATGNPINIVKEGTDKVMTMASTLTSMHSFFVAKNSRLVAACRDELFRMRMDDPQSLSFDFDLDPSDLESKYHVYADEKVNLTAQNKYLFPERPPAKLGLDLLIMDGDRTQAAAHIGINSILHSDVVKAIRDDKWEGVENTNLLIFQKEVSFDKQIGLVVTVDRLDGIAVPEIPSGASKFLSIYAKVKLTDANGKSGHRVIGHEFRTASLPIAKTGMQGVLEFDSSFVFHADQLAVRHSFVRIELCVEDLTTSFSLGAAFIPFDYCENKKTAQFTFPIVPIHDSEKESVRQNAWLTVSLRRIEEISDGGSHPKLLLRSTLRENSIFSTSFAAESIIGQHDSDSPETERMSVSFESTTLRISNLTLAEAVSKSEKKSSKDSSTRLSDVIEEFAPPSDVELFAVEVYENERRALYPPFEWSKTTLTRPTFSNFDYTHSMKLTGIESSTLPLDCEWASDWELDKSFAPGADEDGWVYGISFGRLLAQQRDRLRSAVPSQAHARRRKWTRKVKVSTSAGTTAALMQSAFEKCNEHLHSGKHNRVANVPQSPSLISNDVWRKVQSKKSSVAVLHCCKERENDLGDVTIDWSRVKNPFAVTNSILSLTITVERYFADSKNSFRNCDIPLFVCNCPAEELKNVVDERIALAKTRVEINRVFEQKTKDDFNSNEATTKVECADECVPETAQLSLGSELMCELDDSALIIENRIQDVHDRLLSSSVSARERNHLEQERKLLSRRLCRLRLYIAALIALELSADHSFDVVKLREMLEVDIKMCHRISLDNDVSTARNRIEYLLDIAEKRIRDTALCGWKFRNRGLEKCLEVLTNDLLVEIAGLLGGFFESKQLQASVKGLTSKLELVQTFMQHNDRLERILISALKPFGLRSTPPARLSLFLDFSSLAHWYTNTLELEMRSRAESVLSVWRDKEKDVTGQQQLYSFPHPWTPMRAGNEKAFISNIPEDLAELLLTYIQAARIEKTLSKTLSSATHQQAATLDAKVSVAYTNAFYFLAEQYSRALNEDLWERETSSEFFAERATWLSSVANDGRRILHFRLHEPLHTDASDRPSMRDKLSSKRGSALDLEWLSQITACQSVFSVLIVTALDNLSCLVFLECFSGKEALLRGELINVFNSSDSSHVEESEASPYTGASLLEDIVEDVLTISNEYCTYLVGENSSLFRSIIADKLLVLFFSLLVEYQNRGVIWSGSNREMGSVIKAFRNLRLSLHAFLGISDDVENDQAFSESCSQQLESNDFVDAEYLIGRTCTVSVIRATVPLLNLFGCDLGGGDFESSFLRLKEIAQDLPRDFSVSLANCVETILSLRSIRRYFSSKQLENASLVNSTCRQSNVLLSNSSVPVVATSTQRRSSLGGLISSWAHLGHSVPVVPPTQANQQPAVPALSIVDEDDVRLRRELEESKRLSMETYVDSHVSSLRELATESERFRQREINFNKKYGDPLCTQSSLHRVFAGASKGRSLFADLCQSSLPSDRQELLVTQKPSGSFRVFEMFKEKEKDAKIKDKFSLAQSSENSIASERHTTRATSTKNNLDIDNPRLTLIIHDLRIFGLPQLDLLRVPHPVLEFRVHINNSTIIAKTVSVEGVDGRADWSETPPVAIKIAELSSHMKLEILLLYEGFLSDKLVGSASLSFNPYDPPNLDQKQISLDDVSMACNAAKVAAGEGRPAPCLVASIKFIACSN